MILVSSLESVSQEFDFVKCYGAQPPLMMHQEEHRSDA